MQKIKAMETLKLLLLLPFLGLAVACRDNDKQPVGPCADVPPAQDGIICQAIFERWFYNAKTGTCEQITYTGCEPLGFATAAECQPCQGSGR